MLGLVLGLIAGIPGAAPRATAAALPPFERAQWVWGNPEAPETHLRKVLKLPARPAQASVLITADNGYELFVNGAFVGGESGVESGVWQSVERYDIASKLAPGRNVIGIRGIDLGGVRGVIAAFRIEVTNQPPMEFVTDDSWQVTDEGRPVDYSHPEYVEGPQWTTATALGPMGMAPWGTLNPTNAGGPQRTAKGREFTRSSEPPPGFRWPGPVAFVGEDCSVYVPLRGDAWGVCFRVGDWSRAFTEFDLPCPTKIGRKLLVLTPGPGAQPRVLLDAGAGVLGSPSATFDGRDLLVALARDHDSFFHIWRVPMDGTAPRRLTDGPCHDIDPVELPDGRIVFTSTRIGTFEEYHQPPSRALFRMNADGTDIHPITSTLIFDNEPKVTADGRIAFVRTDNFFDRGKVETQIHSIRPDGTDGLAEFAANVGADYGVRLRAFGFGSPAPLPDGHLAYISSHGNFIGMKGSAQREQIRLPGDLGDLAALPDGRVLCTVLRPDGKRQTSDVLAVFDAADGSLVKLHESASGGLHSPVFAGPRTRPPVIPDYVDRTRADRPDATGFLFCQDARFTTKGRAGWDRIRAIRVLGAVPLTVRSSHSHIVHVGHETVELGTVPLAPDGSFSIEVPADTPLALQAVDGEGRSELNEMSWLYVRPGERRSCIGCHQPREAAPSFHHTPADALRSPPVRLTGQGDPHRFRGNNPGVTGMMDLQFDRFRECASLNRNALRREPNAGRAQELASLKSALSGTNEALRLSSAQRLAMLRDSGAEAPLNSALAQPSRELRVAAALALATCGTREAVKPLLAALSDRDTAVADAAAVALENLTTHPAQRTEAAAWAAWFATNSWESIEAGLVRQLAGRPADVRAAVVALGHVGGESAMAALREFVRTTAARNPYPVFKNDNRTDLFTFPADSPLNPRTLQEAVRALGRLQDRKALPLLKQLLPPNLDPERGNLFLAEAIIEALSRFEAPEVERTLVDAFASLKDYWHYVGWYSDHPALYACHSSPIHARVIAALDALQSRTCGSIVPQLIRSVPTDPDRGLFPQNDDYEVVVGRLLRRSGRGSEVVETCLALLGDPAARPAKDIQAAIRTTHDAWAGHPGPDNRAAQILSLTALDPALEPRVRAAFERYRNRPEERVSRALGNPTWTPVRHWTLFYLGRALGNLANPASVDALAATLADALNEGRHGRPDPSEPDIHFLQLEYTPCWRAAVAWALGEIGDRRAVPALERAVRNTENATDVRHAAAAALLKLAQPSDRSELERLAAAAPEVSVRKALIRAAFHSGGEAPAGASVPGQH